MDKKKRNDIVNQSRKKTQKLFSLCVKKEKGELIEKEAKKRGLSVNKYIIDTVMKDIENNLPQ